MTTKEFFRHRPFCCALGVALAGIVAGCIVEPVGGRAYVAGPVVQVQEPVVVDPAFVYYPSYEVYYEPSTRVYWYPRGSAWVTGPAPGGVSLDVLIASPSVRMDFRDSPANHHAQVIRQYPRDWQPPGRGRR